MKGFFRDFKKFITKGNILDLAIAVIIGTAFNAIVTSLANDIIMPFISAFFGKTDVSEFYATLNGAIIPYGVFLQSIINFLIIGLTLFLIVRVYSHTQKTITEELSKRPTVEERKELKERGTNMKDRKVLALALVELRKEKEKLNIVPKKSTSEELLTDILAELKKQNEISEQSKEEI